MRIHGVVGPDLGQKHVGPPWDAMSLPAPCYLRVPSVARDTRLGSSE